MKTFIKTITDLLVGIGRARAASQLTRQGRYEEARKLMLAD